MKTHHYYQKDVFTSLTRCLIAIKCACLNYIIIGKLAKWLKDSGSQSCSDFAGFAHSADLAESAAFADSVDTADFADFAESESERFSYIILAH